MSNATTNDPIVLENANFIQSLIDRIRAGESMENVKREFVEHFKDSEQEVVIRAEQELLDRGISEMEVNTFVELHGSLMNSAAPITHTLAPGHPIQILNDENIAIEKFIAQIEYDFQAGSIKRLLEKMTQLNQIRVHYMKKEGLIMPVLYRKGFTGPSTIMWDKDNEIKHEIKILTRDLKKFFAPDNIQHTDELLAFKLRIDKLFAQMRDMITREERVFFPVALKYLTQEDWLEIYRDMDEYGFAFLNKDQIPIWAAGDVWQRAQTKFFEKTFEPPADFVTNGMIDGKIKLPTGEITIRQLEAVLKLLPIDITFIDENDKIRFFVNEGKIFPRPRSVLGRDVMECHPPKLVPMIKQLLNDFRNKTRDHLEICKIVDGKPLCVDYVAVYDDRGRYIGTVEFVQNFENAISNFAHASEF